MVGAAVATAVVVVVVVVVVQSLELIEFSDRPQFLLFLHASVLEPNLHLHQPAHQRNRLFYIRNFG